MGKMGYGSRQQADSEEEEEDVDEQVPSPKPQGPPKRTLPTSAELKEQMRERDRLVSNKSIFAI